MTRQIRRIALGLLAGLLVAIVLAQPAIAAQKTPPTACRNGYVSLSFDDSPTGLTPNLLAALKSAKLQATFFDVGSWAEQLPASVTAQRAGGHWVGNHSYSHPDLVALGEPAAAKELSRTQAILTPAVGAAPAVFRPPFGSTSPQVEADAIALGLTEVIWTVDPQDWSTTTTTPAIVNSVLTVKAGGFVLMHDGYLKTLNAIPKIASGLADRGLCAGKIVYSAAATASWAGGPTFNATVAAPNSTAPSGPPPAADRSRMSFLADNFDGASLNTSVWDGSTTGTVGQSDGRAFIPCSSDYPSIGTNTTRDLTNSGAFAQFTTPAVGNGSREVFLQLVSAGGDRLQWARSGSGFRPRYLAAGMWTDGPLMTYDPTAHAWWRIRESGGSILWDTSANGFTWTTAWSTPMPFPVTSMTADVVCGNWGDEAATLYIDNFNVVPAAS